MPWRQVDPMIERLRFIRDARQRVATFADLCRLYGITRTTGYKWLHRAEESGIDYLQELSRRPHSCPHATPPALTARLLEARSIDLRSLDRSQAALPDLPTPRLAPTRLCLADVCDAAP